MKYLLLFFFTFTGLMSARAQQNYDVNLIPKELMAYASSVVRDMDESVEVKDLHNTIYHIKKAVTVLNNNGDDNAHIVIYYDNNDKVRGIKGVAYNEFGKTIAKFSESDFADQSVSSSSSLFESERIKHYLPAITQYPYTLVYEYEVHTKQTLNFNVFEPNSNTGEAVEKSSFTFSCKPDFLIRYKESNISTKASIRSDKDGRKVYSWQVNNLKAITHEPYSPYYKNVIPSVQIAPEKFTYYGIEGSYTDWKSLGKWEYDKLISARRELPQETIDHVKEITRGIAVPKLKAKKIYEYMQGKTHYVSVQIGIGGYQPFFASDVDKQNYGDCKALVNYTQALLKVADIDSYYCVVKSGVHYKVNLLPDFATMEQGDHIILCLPFKNDTTWCDCTSQTIPFGYLGDFTDDRFVLACTPDGGRLLHTPKYNVNDNLENRKAAFMISTDGEISGNMNSVFKGADYEDRDELVNESKTEQDKIIKRIYPINNLEIEQYDLKQDKSFDPSTTENIKLHARDYASFADGKYYFLLNPVNRIGQTPKQVANRQNDVYINRGYTETDEICYIIPAGYHLEKGPLNLLLDKPFGNFTVTMALTGNQLTYVRRLQLIDGTYRKDTYQDLVDFYQEVVDADGYTVSLIKN